VNVWAAFGWATFGGAIGNFVGFHDLAKQAPENWPAWTRMPSFYALGAVWGLIGGALAAAYVLSNMPMTPLLAINVGLTAPFILVELMRRTPPIPPGKTD
jgi:hypothetical protein